MKKPAFLIVALVFTIIALSLVKTYISNNVATSGVKLAEAEQEINKLKTENALLSEKLYKESSLTSVWEKAEKIGYVKKAAQYVLNSQIPIAVKK
ncbi:MAG: hypothetical protein COU25_03265 [Candidatus Levybacteria bacterium CG10_big_fil_rev_8_21_14_0_10_35_13]|nr:MAG: hypothetical protein COU25_03265 [Candidatus Levybacteria bacterium CG10_big_fil_rev_8_21_14_0_10_35_13]